MKEVTKTFQLYEFDELNRAAKDKAINEHIQLEIGFMDADSPYVHCADEMERMQTPWFLAGYIYKNHKADIIDTIRANEYLFFDDGSLIPTDLYPNN